MNRPFGFAWIWGLATLVIASIVGVFAFIAGHATEVVTTNPEAGTAVNNGYYYGHFGFGFFPFFGFLWFLLIVFLLFALFRRGMGWKRGYWGGGPYGGGYWHQHSHEHGGPTTPGAPTTPPAGGEPEQPKSA
jgi:hypothetical protein